MSSTRVALAGATGNLGIPVLEGLLAAQFEVTILSRVGGNSSKLIAYPSLKIREVVFDDLQSLTSALEGIEVVISCFATLAMGLQNTLIDACCAAGVQRFIPAEFGIDSLNPLCMQLPVCQLKTDTQEHLRRATEQHPNFSWTSIANGLFLDWGLEVGFILDVPGHTATLYDGGDVPFSATTLSDVTKAIISVTNNQKQTKNRVLYIQSALVTQNQLIQLAKAVDGKEWSVERKNLTDVLRQSYAELEAGNEQTAMDGFCVVAMWGKGYGGDFSAHLDNELLGLKQLHQDELADIIAALL